MAALPEPVVRTPEDPTKPDGPDAPGRAIGRFARRPAARAVLAGLLLAGSLPPWGWWPLAFVGLALLDQLLAGAPWKTRLGRGTVVGMALFAPTVVWISELTAPGYVIAILFFGGLNGLFAAAVPPGAGRRPALIGAWALCESLRMAWPFGGVPLSLLAVGQVGGLLVGLARVSGVLAIAIGTVAVGVAISAAFDRQARQATTAVAAVIALLLVAAIAPHGHNTGRRLDVGIVQGGGPQGTNAIDTDERKVFERHLAASDRLPKGLDLVLWPEDVVDTDGPVQSFGEGRNLQALARKLEAPLVVGTVETVSDIEFRNSSQVLTKKGRWVGRFTKVQRVPFGEWVPFRSVIEKVAPDTLASRDATVSHGSGLLPTPVAPLAVVISWEVFFGHRARSGVNAGGQLVYNPTNGSTYTGTFVQTQQLASSRLRAIETGRWVAQVAPTGFSAFISPSGRVHQRTATRERAVRVRPDVPLRTGRTWYVRWGDLPARVAAVVLLAAGWALDRRGRARSPRARTTDGTSRDMGRHRGGMGPDEPGLQGG